MLEENKEKSEILLKSELQLTQNNLKQSEKQNITYEKKVEKLERENKDLKVQITLNSSDLEKFTLGRKRGC